MVSSRNFFVLFLVGLYEGHRSGLVDAKRLPARGIRLPPRREIISQRDFRAKVVFVKWYQLYFGSTLPSAFLHGEFQFVPDGTLQVTVKLKADLPVNESSVQCITEAGLGSPVLRPVNSVNAEFISSNGIYWAFFSSDLDSYLLNVECTSGRRVIRCPVSDTRLSIYVKSLRPDSVPLHRALFDLWRVSGVKLDVDPVAFPFVFTLGKNISLYGDHRSGIVDAQTLPARGIRLPPRREIISLRDFRMKVAGVKWYQLYFGSTLPSAFLNGKFEFVLEELTSQIAVTLTADLPVNESSVQCVTEADFGSPVLSPVNSLKAEFTSNSGSYWSFFSSDLDSYLLNLECTSGRPFIRCPVSDTFLSIYVKSLRPDSVPLQRALRDLWRVSAVTLDVDPGAFPFVFTLGKNTCPNEEW